MPREIKLSEACRSPEGQGGGCASESIARTLHVTDWELLQRRALGLGCGQQGGGRWSPSREVKKQNWFWWENGQLDQIDLLRWEG